ncbi:zinc metalloproteinase nas-13-like [Penaeus indicus]|uniref:zinc metalloproteinase nas-13-like n=1 Tax=Penaeus indicus TaxID=29960 RepID=UPI00300D32C4
MEEKCGKRNATGCWSHIGYIGGRQWLNYQDRCLWRFGTVVHELFHTLGLFHEQSRPDRDNFVKVKWDNIRSGYHHNFIRLGNKRATTLGVDYNYASVMHYSPKAFSKNKKKLTIVPKKNYDKNIKLMGQRKGPALSDLEKINKLYKCKETEEED